MSILSASIFSGEVNFYSKSQKYCDETVSKNLSHFICYHQGEFIQYAFLAGEYHKAMKTEFIREKQDRGAIHAKHDELIEFLNEKIGKVVSASFELMRPFFSDRHVKPPRICLKANYDPKEKLVIGLFREQKVGYNSDCSVHENKGFNHVRENGRYFLCQNIPKDTQKGEYYNPRILKQAVDNYRPKNRIIRHMKSKNKIFIDEDWVNCWKRIDSCSSQPVKPHYRSCYKSTLIIPLTLWNNKLNKHFLSKFNITDVDRTIFGYLCFDHIETNFFNPVFDIDIGYIFADILSLYLLIRFVFVDQSTTYNAVRNYLAG